MASSSGLLPNRRPVNNASFNANAIQQQFSEIIDALRSLKGSGLARGAVGLPDVDTPRTTILIEQLSVGGVKTNHFTVSSIENRAALSVVKQLDAEVFQFSVKKPGITPEQAITFGHRHQIELSCLRDIPHQLGRTPLGFIPLGNWYCQYGETGSSPDVIDTNYGIAHIFEFPVAQKPRNQSGIAIANGVLTKDFDGLSFNIGIAFPVQRSTVTGLVISPQYLRDFVGKLLLF